MVGFLWGFLHHLSEAAFSVKIRNLLILSCPILEKDNYIANSIRVNSILF